MKPRGGCNGDLALHKDLTVLLGKDKDIDIQIKDIFHSWADKDKSQSKKYNTGLRLIPPIKHVVIYVNK